MDIKNFCDSIMRMYLYADMIKAIHLSTEIYWEHSLCDDAQDKIRDKIDELAEQIYGYYGKPKFTDFKLDLDIYYENDLAKLFGCIMDILAPIRTECDKVEKLSGVVSLIDDFKGELTQLVYMCSFDKISNYKMENSI